jgi:hypothetical protein
VRLSLSYCIVLLYYIKLFIKFTMVSRIPQLCFIGFLLLFVMGDTLSDLETRASLVRSGPVIIGNVRNELNTLIVLLVD